MKHSPGDTWSVADQTFHCVAGLNHTRGERIGDVELRQLLIQDRQVPYEVWEVSPLPRPGAAT